MPMRGNSSHMPIYEGCTQACNMPKLRAQSQRATSAIGLRLALQEVLVGCKPSQTIPTAMMLFRSSLFMYNTQYTTFQMALRLWAALLQWIRHVMDGRVNGTFHDI